MTTKYKHLLSPLKIGNIVLKNRLLSANATPHFFQGPESFPTENIISYLAGLARNGAAIVSFADWSNPEPRKNDGHRGRLPCFDLDDPATDTYFCQLTDAIHFYNSRACIGIRSAAPKGYGASTSEASPPVPDMNERAVGPGEILVNQKEMTDEMIQEVIAETVKRCKYYQSVGFDMTSFPLAYRNTILAQFISPIHNKRKDKYGGNIENRARFVLEICDAVKKACGQNFLIELIVSGEDGMEGGNTIDDIITFAKLCEGRADIFQIRSGDADLSHPTGFNSSFDEPITLKYAETLKNSGTSIIVEPIGGYQDADQCDKIIAMGKADMIGMGRSFICDPEYGLKLSEGRGEDVIPCIRCHKCHGIHVQGPWINVCSVNPIMGVEQKINRMLPEIISKKKVAIIGGGPAGMKAAIVCADRGHQVTLFEKEKILGGQLIHANYNEFKWPVKRFKDYLVSQIYKKGVRVLLNTQATAELIKLGGYDVVLAAVGAEPSISDIPGASRRGIWVPIDVYSHENELGENVVVVGGSEIGTETGMYLAKKGHLVTVLTRKKFIADTARRAHYYSPMQKAWESLENFSYINFATTTRIEANGVIYMDIGMKEHRLPADSVVLSSGMISKQEEALNFRDAAGSFHMIGDCYEVGNIQKSIRSAFATASLI